MTNPSHSSEPEETRSNWLTHKLLFGLTPAALIVLALMLLSATLHLINIDAIEDANTYYTAAVKSMLQSWDNFFFVAAEPGGSVSVDKPPLGLWVEAAFAWVLGVTGFAVSLPNILSSILGIPLLYTLVKRYFGVIAGLTAALVMAITPVLIAADRNNTMDGMLTFTLLLAAWAFVRASEGRGQLFWLLLGAFIVGLGFNIKMLQAFLPLPAFYAFYFLSSKTGWLRKIFNLVLTSILLLIVSLSWAVVVDSVPAEQRPYVGSSSDNTVMELIVGHNGLARLFGRDRYNNAEMAVIQNADGNRPLPGSGQTQPGGAFSQETGQAGLLRFFEPPLAKEMSWLLPLALAGLVLSAFSGPQRFPLVTAQHKGMLLWGGWLATCLVFFSVAGFFHAYYLIMLVPALGAMVGAAISILLTAQQNWKYWLMSLAAIVTLLFQVHLAARYGQRFSWAVFIILLLTGSIFLVFFSRNKKTALHILGSLAVIVSLVAIPLTWSFLTVLNETPNNNLPSAYAGENKNRHQGKDPAENLYNQKLLAFLEENAGDSQYLLAVPNAHTGAYFVMETGLPVLYMGGFTGSDPVVDAADLAELAQAGDLSYILYGGQQGSRDREILFWLNTQCTLVPEFSRNLQQPGNSAPAQRPFPAIPPQRMPNDPSNGSLYPPQLNLLPQNQYGAPDDAQRNQNPAMALYQCGN